MMKQTRRQFIGAAAAGVAVASALGKTQAVAAVGKKPQVCIFSKHLQFLDYEQLAKTCKEVGLDGVDMPVRKGGHVLPENVKTDLPKAVAAVRKQGLEVPMITTKLVDGDDPDAHPILEAASKLGIKYFRVGGQKYDTDGDILPQLAKFTGQLRRLAKVAEKYDMTAGYHNHSGMRNVGGSIWDLYRMIEEVGSDNFGSNFDVGHVTVEGSYGSWQTNSRLMAPKVKMMAVKDYVTGEGPKPVWVPLGEGRVEIVEILSIMRKSGFHGPISIHIEYKVESDDAMIEEVRKSAAALRGIIREAGY